MARLSRQILKDELKEVIDEILDEIADNPENLSPMDETNMLTDAVYGFLTERDSGEIDDIDEDTGEDAG